jgi:hypothetical protein
MTAKKKTEEVADETPEPVAPPKSKEKLVTVHALEWFSDGNLQDFMAQYGYPCDWPANESRSLPMWLIQRCISSGGEFEADA